MTVPDWVQDSVFYQIFPDRFANGDPSNDPPGVQPWGTLPGLRGFQGGDLRGIEDHLDYLADLAVTGLYLNPIFRAASNHRYDTTDYFRIDDRLGTRGDFRRLVEAAHRRGLRVILDGVFNHCGRGFAAFRDILDQGVSSRYRDWFHIRRFPADAFGEGPAQNYAAWWGFRSLPKFNTDNPQVREYLLNVARYWIEQGADGWRLDVPNEIADPTFWEAFHRTVRRVNREAYLLGEIWTVDPGWVGTAAFDGLMNYPLRLAILDWVLTPAGSATEFRARVEAQQAAYPPEHRLAHYNLVGSHDTERIATLAGNDRAALRLIFTLQFTLPGVPGIYYGDEIGLDGGKDPECRGAFPWDSGAWDGERRAWIAGLARLRKDRVELRRGDLEFLLADDERRLLAYARRSGESTAVVALNLSEQPRDLTLAAPGTAWPPGKEVQDALTGRRLGVGPTGLTFPLGPRQAMVIID